MALQCIITHCNVTVIDSGVKCIDNYAVSAYRRRRLFPFRKQAMPFLTVDAIIGNQAFRHDRCNICSEF